ncbi:MAG: hypothetical protein ACOZBV_08640 [Pseudomonadota bacterium]
MLIGLLALTLALLAGALALPRALAAPPAFWAHLVLAMGVMSLITAAMQHFVPVLTRGQGVSSRMARLPLLMFAAGALACLALLGVVPYLGISAAAALALVGLGLMLRWVLARARLAVGRPHPGLHWYVAALACLASGLIAALLIPFWPEQQGLLRGFHLHINLYGFVGLTAVGTLQVLLPTAAGSADPGVATRLKADLKWALAGSLALALGQAGAWPGLAALGAAAWAWPLARMLAAWWQNHRARIFAWHGAAPVLGAAALGLVSALAGSLSGREAIGPLTILLPGFLFPLVVGAASQLAPVFLRPGVATDWHARSRATLGRGSGLRALLFLSAAWLPLLGYKCSDIPGLVALLWFVVVFVIWLFRD